MNFFTSLFAARRRSSVLPSPRRRRVALVAAALVIPAGLGVAASVVTERASAEPADAPPLAASTSVQPQPQSPFAAIPEPPLAEELAFSGVVRDVKPAGSYVYLAVENASGASRWIATHAKASSPVGSEVDVRVFAARTDFTSPRLGRSFDRLLFGIVTRRNVR